MSTPVDIPQNINIHVSHLDRVVEAPKTNVAENSADRSSLEMGNKETSHKHLVHKKDKEEEREKENRKQDHFEKQTFHQEREQSQPDKQNQPSVRNTDKDDDNKDLGKKIDFSV